MKRRASVCVRRVRRELLDPLMRSAYSLMLNSVATAALGLVFWVLAAREQRSSQIGQDSALIASMMTLSSICQLNLANTITRFLPRAGGRTRRWVLGAYGLAALATTVGAALFVLVVPSIIGGLAFLRREPLVDAAFVAAAALWSLFGLQDAVLTGMRRAPWVPLENAIYGVLKIGLLPLLAAVAFTHAVFVSWTLPMAILLVPVNWLIFSRFIPGHVRRHPESRPVRELLPSRRLARFLLGDYLGSVAQQAALALPALLVIGLLGSSANAWFYMPFMLVTGFDTLFFNASVSIVVEGAFASGSAAELTRRVVSRLGTLVLPGVLAMVVAAPLLLEPFGRSYAQHGAAALRLLALASVFRITITLFAAVARIEGRGGAIFAAYGGVLVLLVALSLVLCPSLGIAGAALAWLAANAVVAAVAMPTLLRLLRGTRAEGELHTPAVPVRRPVWPGWIERLRRQPSGAAPRRGQGVGWVALSRIGIFTSAAAVAATFPIIAPGARAAVLVAFLCTAPGTALVGVLERRTERFSPVLVLAAGPAIGVLLAAMLLWLDVWRPAPTLVAGALGCLLALIALRRWRR